MSFDVLPATLTANVSRPRARLWAAALLALSAAVPGSASAGVADVITTSVKTYANQVTYARVASSGAPLVTYIGYEFRTAYTGTNTTNGVELVGELRVTDPAQLATLALDTANSPSYCSAQSLADRIRLVCTLGQLRSGSADRVFSVLFKAPSKVEGNGVGDAEGSDLVTLTGSTLYAEGNDGAGNTNNSAAWVADGPTTVTLGTVVTDRIKSVLPKSGGRLFSGDAGLATQDDLFVTDVAVPAFTGLTSAEILEGVEPREVCASSIFSTFDCYTLDLSINDSAGVTVIFADTLSIKISIDGSIIPPKYRPQDLTIRYEGSVVGACPAAGVPLDNGFPCISSAVRIKDKKNRARDGDIEIEFLNFKNGRFSIG